MVQRYDTVVIGGGMVADATYSDIARAIHVHPTIAEAINTAAGGIHREIGL